VPRTGGKVKEGDLSAGQVFARRLAEVREARDWSQKRLSERMTELGHPIHRVKLAKIEKERARSVTLEDVLALSYALDVSPLYMVAPLEADGPRLTVVGNEQPADPDDARAWLRGDEPLLGQDEFTWTMQRPAREVPAQLERRPNVMRRLQQTTQYPKEEL
jgi:transcriptional regulator with XRE-family HTH domain